LSRSGGGTHDRCRRTAGRESGPVDNRDERAGHAGTPSSVQSRDSVREYDAVVEAVDVPEFERRERLHEPLAVDQRRCLPAADDERADEHAEFVDEVGLEQREEEFAAALGEQTPDPLGLQGVQRGGEVDPLGPRLDHRRARRSQRRQAILGGRCRHQQIRLGVVVQQRRVQWRAGTGVGDDPCRIRRSSVAQSLDPPVFRFHAEVGVVREGRPGADEDGVGGRSEPVDAVEIRVAGDTHLAALAGRELPVHARRRVDDDFHTLPSGPAGKPLSESPLHGRLSTRERPSIPRWPTRRTADSVITTGRRPGFYDRTPNPEPMQLDDHAEELASDLGVDKAEVKDDLESLLEYNVPVAEAKASVRRKHGGDDGSTATPTAKSLADVRPDDGSVTVTARVLTKGTRSIRYQGEDQVIREGEFADDTGRLSYTAWESFDFEPGDSITVGNANVREWEGSPELNLGTNTTVAPASESIETPYEVGGDRDLIDLEPGDRGRTVEVTVQELDRRTIDGRDGETEILSGVVADETARLPLTDWDPHGAIEEGASLRLSDVYVREYRGVPQVNVTEFSTVERLGREIPAPATAPRMGIGEAVDSGGLFDVELVGNVIEVRDGSGLIERCPECGRVVQNGQCRAHGDVEGEDDLRVKAILDDGTGMVTVVLDTDLTAAVYGGDVEDAKDAARDAMDKAVVADAIRHRIVGREYRVRGSLSVDEYGANLDAEEFAESADDPADRASELLAGVAR